MKKIVFLILILIITALLFQVKMVKSYQFNPESRENILIILDSSYSMADKIGAEQKIDIAKNTINQVLSQLSPEAYVGLRVYGHKSDFFGFRACRASELKVPIAPYSLDKIKNEISKMKPVGWTPITYSIKQAMAVDFQGMTGKKRIILVSDGMETCDESPCEYVLSLVKQNNDLKIDVIGFDLNDPAAVSQLKCTALATKGKFYQAHDANSLNNSLIQSLNISKEVEGKIIKNF